MADSSGSTSPLAADLATSLHLAEAAAAANSRATTRSSTTSAHRRHLEHDDSSSTSTNASTTANNNNNNNNNNSAIDGVAADANDVEAPALPPHKRVRCSSQSVVFVTPNNAASSVDEDDNNDNNTVDDLLADRSAVVHAVRGVDTDGWLRSSPQHLTPFVQLFYLCLLFFFFFFHLAELFFFSFFLFVFFFFSVFPSTHLDNRSPFIVVVLLFLKSDTLLLAASHRVVALLRSAVRRRFASRRISAISNLCESLCLGAPELQGYLFARKRCGDGLFKRWKPRWCVFCTSHSIASVSPNCFSCC
jgi:hypothetical protein